MDVAYQVFPYIPSVFPEYIFCSIHKNYNINNTMCNYFDDTLNNNFHLSLKNKCNDYFKYVIKDTQGIITNCSFYVNKLYDIQEINFKWNPFFNFIANHHNDCYDDMYPNKKCKYRIEISNFTDTLFYTKEYAEYKYSQDIKNYTDTINYRKEFNEFKEYDSEIILQYKYPCININKGYECKYLIKKVYISDYIDDTLKLVNLIKSKHLILFNKFKKIKNFFNNIKKFLLNIIKIKK